MLHVNWPQLRSLLTLDESFAATGGDYESYIVNDQYCIRVRHVDYDNEVYTVDRYVQLINDEEDDSIVCVIQLEGPDEDPVWFNTASDTIEIEIYSKCTTIPPQ